MYSQENFDELNTRISIMHSKKWLVIDDKPHLIMNVSMHHPTWMAQLVQHMSLKNQKKNW